MWTHSINVAVYKTPCILYTSAGVLRRHQAFRLSIYCKCSNVFYNITTIGIERYATRGVGKAIFFPLFKFYWPRFLFSVSYFYSLFFFLSIKKKSKQFILICTLYVYAPIFSVSKMSTFNLHEYADTQQINTNASVDTDQGEDYIFFLWMLRLYDSLRLNSVLYHLPFTIIIYTI